MMKSFLKKILAFVLLFLVLAVLLTLTSNYHFGNKVYSSKIRFLQQAKQPYNTFFFGSSKVHRQLDPQLFDSLTNATTGTPTKSFNLGAPATRNPEIYYLYENFLNSPLSKTARYCFVELRHVAIIYKNQLHAEQTTYWQNYKDLRYATNSIFYETKSGNAEKVKILSNHVLSYFEGALHIGHFGEGLLNADHYSSSYLGRKGNGFYPLDKELEDVTNPDRKSQFVNRRQFLLDYPDTMQGQKNNVSAYYQLEAKAPNPFDLERINSLIQKSKEKGIHVIFFTPPPRPREQLLHLSREIPGQHFVNLFDPSKYPELYTYDYYFDRGHMNSLGAEKITTVLAQRFNEIRSETEQTR